MRLTCPNCDAIYEVEARLVPAEGCDVQCSACGHVWFQSPDFDEPDFDGDDADAPTVPEAPMPAAAEASPPPPAPPEEEEEAEEPPPAMAPPARPALDPAMLAVLREEAERETRARAEEAARAAGRGVEMQPDLGLPDAEPPSRLRIRPRPDPAPEPGDGADPAAETPAPAQAAMAAAPRVARRELLPDIDHINSTLDASTAARRGDGAVSIPTPPEARRSGFRSGFLLMLVLAGLGWALYVQAPNMAQSLPQLERPLNGYVAAVDRARLGLDGLMANLLASLQN